MPSCGSWLHPASEADPGTQGMTQVAGFLTPTWETWIAFLAPGLGLTSSCYCGHLGSKPGCLNTPESNPVLELWKN